MDDLRARPADAARPRPVLAARREQAVRGTEEARRPRTRPRHQGDDGQATPHRLLDHRQGRRAMAAWVPQPGAGPVLEFEALVKLFYAEHGTKHDILATLDCVRAWSDDRHRDSAGISQAYLDGEGAFPERLPWLVLCGQFLEEFDIMVERWTEWAASVVATWPDDITTAVARARRPRSPSATRRGAAHNDHSVARPSSRRRGWGERPMYPAIARGDDGLRRSMRGRDDGDDQRARCRALLRDDGVRRLPRPDPRVVDRRNGLGPRRAPAGRAVPGRGVGSAGALPQWGGCRVGKSRRGCR